MTTTDIVPDGLVPADILTAETPVAVYAEIRIRPDRDADFRALIDATVPLVRAEDGHEQYEVHAAKGEPGTYALYERWSSGLALAAHVRQPFMLDYFGRLPEMLAGEFETRWLVPVRIPATGS
ncbi:putative quinol monooxygenase [Actinoplanes sp. G11-F43]|uniref:putative quinol monooxygenase n=1 Tax=Actinoplanes sp. G11-F43 TaxID=3424130 RepID=UPI003D3543E5